MNLFGLRNIKENNMLTLDKINSHIRKHIRGKNIQIKILQTHNEAKAVSYIQNNRKKINGLILTPCAWNNIGFILNELLTLFLLILIFPDLKFFSIKPRGTLPNFILNHLSKRILLNVESTI